MIILLGLAIYVGMMYVNKYGGTLSAKVYEPHARYDELVKTWPADDIPEIVKIGKEKYPLCAGCHQPNGMGLPGLYPPLVASDWVLEEDPSRIIRVVLNGLQGPITVNGAEYNNVMTPFGALLSDEEVAGVLSYIRYSEWQGDQAAPLVTPEQVAAVRAEVGNRTQMFTAEELLAIPVE